MKFEKIALLLTLMGLFVAGLVFIFVVAERGPELANGKRCPSGTEIVGAAPPDSYEQWCRRKHDSVKEGSYIKWGCLGRKKEEAEYKNGKRESLTTWYENGRRTEEAEFKDGEKEGRQTTWYENGQKMVESEIRDGKNEGLWTYWYENGQKKMEGMYQNGRAEGRWMYWHPNGKKRKEVEYEEGEWKRCRTFERAGSWEQ